MTAAGETPADLEAGSSSKLRGGRARVLTFLGLLGVCALFAILVAAIHPTAFFGLSEDDSIYFSSARALANGHGYLLESVPGSPRASKYPVFYSWLLSWIWRWQPTFPANLGVALRLNALFGVVYIFAAFYFLRSFKGLTDLERVLLAAFCGLHPVTIFHAANLLSDLPFAAAVLSALAFYVWMASRGEDGRIALCCGFLAGAALALRTLGLPILAGLALGFALQRRWRGLFFFGLGAAPLSLVWLAGIKLAHAQTGMGTSLCSTVWRANWLYYTDYLGFWRADLLQNHVFWQSLKQSFLLLLLQPGSYLIAPTSLSGLLAFVPALVLSVLALCGLWKQTRDGRVSAVVLVLCLYAVPVVIWDYPAMGRFLMPFLPLFVGGAWIEGKRIVTRVAATVRAHGLRQEGPAIVVLSLAAFGLVIGMGWSLWRGHVVLTEQAKRRASFGTEKREAYDWLRKNAAPDASVIAYEDAALYLYSGHQAFRPVIFLPAGRFRPAIMQAELACISDSGAQTRATYWMVSEDDFDFEWEPAAAEGLNREKRFLSERALVFRGRADRVRIYQLVSDAGRQQ
jgi:hypothetical protein